MNTVAEALQALLSKSAPSISEEEFTAVCLSSNAVVH